MFACGGGGGRALLCAQRLYYGRDQLDCPPPNGLNHNLPLNKTQGAHSTGERFRATMALLFRKCCKGDNTYSLGCLFDLQWLSFLISGK